MPKNTSFILGDHFDSFVSEQVESGRYANAADVIRSALRLLEEREDRLHALRQALVDGEESGNPSAFDLDKILDRARRDAGASDA
ncbi:MAG: type II toxin-antitoxin system ParD family antitoxin [Maritimibacter harenae]